MDAVDPGIINRMDHYTSEVVGVEQASNIRARWVGHRLYAELTIVVDEQLSFIETHSIAENVRKILHQALPHLSEVTIHVDPTYEYQSNVESLSGLASILPPRYQDNLPSAAPISAASLKFADDGSVAWNEIWTDFCDLALAGGPPHRGNLLEPIDPEEIKANPEDYNRAFSELERGLTMVTGRKIVQSDVEGWIGLQCDSEDMALWLLRAIVVENIMTRREQNILYFPVGPSFRLEKEIKNVITVVAKTTHYWQEHIAGSQ